MKKILSLVVLAASGFSVLGQGTLFFQNGGTQFLDPAVDRLVYKGEVGIVANRLIGTNYVAQLWYERAGTTELVPVPHANAMKLFRSGAVVANNGQWATTGGATVVLDGIAVLASTRLQVRVWDIAQFGTHAAAVAGGGEHGESNIWDHRISDSTNPAEYGLNGLRAFAVVPEPSAIVLGVLGVASLLLLRRRK